MSLPTKCKTCGCEISAGALEGLCPECLGKLVLENTPANPSAPAPAQPSVTRIVPEPAADEAVGATLGRYKLREKLGEGGCGTVYVAEQTEPVRRKVALKVIKLGMDTREVIARFEAERQALAMMDHPNIAKVLDAGTTDSGRPYFVMELVRGVRITDYCDQANLTTKERLDLFIKVCQAIQHAHQKGIIHRDIKPSNILVTLHDGMPVPKVIDFGIAKATEGRLTDATVYTQLHQFMGTPAYMSPEQAEMSGLDIDTRSDIYSLGVLLYQLLTSKTPFDGQELLSMGLDAMRKMIREKEPVRPSTRVATLLGDDLTTTARRRAIDAPKLIHLLKGDLDWIVMKALEKDRTRRYDTANGLAQDIVRHLNNEPVVARPPSTAYKFQKAWQRNKLAFTAATSVAVALLAGIGVSTWQAFVATRARATAQAAQAQAHTKELEADAERQRAEGLLQDAKVNLARQYLHRGHAFCERGEVTRGLHWFAKALNETPRKNTSLRAVIRENLSAWSRDFNPPVAILHHDTFLAKIAYSPDGTRVATGTLVGLVQIWSAATGEPLGEPMRHEGPIRTLAFSPDGKIVLSSTYSGDRTAKLWSAETGKILQSLVEFRGYRGDQEGRTHFSPDGKRVLGPSADNTARMWSVETGEPIGEPLRHEDRVLAGAFSSDGTRALTGSADHNARLWSFEGGAPKCLIMKHEEPVYDVMFSSDGKLVITLTGQSVHFWSVETGQPVGPPLQHGSQINALALSSDGKRVVTGGDKAARLWSVETRQQVGEVMWHEGTVRAVAFGSGGKFIVTGSEDKTARLWSGETGELLSSPMLHAAEVSQVAFSPDGTRVLTGQLAETAVLWSLRPGVVNAPILLEASSWLESVAFSPDGKRLAGDQAGGQAGKRDGTQMWTVNSGQRVGAPMNPRGSSVWALAFSPDGKSLLTGCKDGIARLWSGETGEPLGPQFVHKKDVRSVAFSRDGKLAATGSFDNTARLWSTATGQPVGPVLEHSNVVQRVVFSPDGKNLLTACGDGAARLWSVQTGKLVLPPLWHRGFLIVATFSPDGSQIVTGGRDNMVRFWDAGSGRPTGLVLEHRSAMEGLCFTVDGRRLWTLSAGVFLWDVETGERIGPALPASGIDFALSPDGTRMAIAREEPPTVRLLPPSASGEDFEQAALWAQVLTWTEMDEQGALTWLDAATRTVRRMQLETLRGPRIRF